MTRHEGLAPHPAARSQSGSLTPLQGLAAWLLNLSNRAWVKARGSSPPAWPARGDGGGRRRVHRAIFVFSPTGQVDGRSLRLASGAHQSGLTHLAVDEI